MVTGFGFDGFDGFFCGGGLESFISCKIDAAWGLVRLISEDIPLETAPFVPFGSWFGGSIDPLAAESAETDVSIEVSLSSDVSLSVVTSEKDLLFWYLDLGT